MGSILYSAKVQPLSVVLPETETLCELLSVVLVNPCSFGWRMDILPPKSSHDRRLYYFTVKLYIEFRGARASGDWKIFRVMRKFDLVDVHTMRSDCQLVNPCLGLRSWYATTGDIRSPVYYKPCKYRLNSVELADERISTIFKRFPKLPNIFKNFH